MSIEFTILNAIRDSDAEQLEALLEKPDNVSRLAKSLHLGMTFQTDSLEIVRKLISFEEIRSVLGQDRLAVLRYAIIGNNPEVVKALLELDEVHNNSMVSNNQVLAVAIMQNNLEMVKMLLKIPDIRKNLLNGEYGILGDNSFFGYAAFAGQTEIIKYLLEIDEIKENAAKMDNAALKLAILGGHHDITNLLLTNEAVMQNIASDNNNVFSHAVEKGHIDTIDSLLAFPEVANNISFNSNFSLRVAIQKNNIELIQKLLNYPAVVSKVVEENQLSEYLGCASLEAVKLLLSEKNLRKIASKNSNEGLRIVAARNDPAIIKELLTIEEVAKNAHTLANEALKIAIQNGHLEVVRELLNAPAVVESLKIDNLDILRGTTLLGRVDIVKLLLEQDYIRQNVAFNNNNILMIAIENGLDDLVLELLNDKSVQAQLAMDKTPLLSAMNFGKTDIALEILEIDAVKKSITDIQLLGMAVQYGNDAIFDKLWNIPYQNVDLSSDDNAILYSAVQKGTVHMVNVLLEVPEIQAKAAVKENRILKMASLRGDLPIVKRLLKVPIILQNAAANDNLALRLATFAKHEEVTHQLLKISTVKTATTLVVPEPPIEIQDIVVVALDAFNADHIYNSRTLTGEFGNIKADETNQEARLFASIKSLMDRAAYTHKLSHCDFGNHLKKTSEHKITRLVTNEFLFYTKTPLTLEKFGKLQELILQHAKAQANNLHFVLSTFAVKTPDGKLMNVAAYVVCGENAKVDFIVKNNPSAIDPVYTEIIEEGEKIPIFNVDLNKGDRPDLCKVDILGEPHYFTFNNLVRCPTAGGQSFFTGVELCLDHSYGVMKNNFNNIVLQHVESLVEGVESDPLPTRFSHVISSNSCQVIEEHTIGLPTHADPSSAFLEKNEKMAPFFGHEGKPKKSDPKSYSMPLSFGATVTLMKTKPFVVENVEFLSRLQNGVKESTRASKENENRKSLLFKKMHTDVQEPLQEPLVQKTTHNEPVDSQRKKTH